MTSPPRKKLKYGPAMVVEPASQLVKGQGSDEAFHIKWAELHEFFPNSTSEPQILSEVDRQNVNITIDDDFRKADCESAYRNAIYRQLTDNQKGDLETVPGTSGLFGYKEIDLIGLFQAFVEKNATDGNGDGARDRITPKEKEYLEDSLRREEHGLKITTTSMPGLAFLRHSDSAVEFVLGEVKHDGQYTREHAEQQVACYLQALLYFLRVKTGLPVTAVHGFTVCGPKCNRKRSSSKPKYAVSFVKLAAPQTFNGKFKVSSYFQTCDASDSKGLKLLAHFLKHGHAFEYDQNPVRWEERRELNLRCPSLFSVPPVLWKDINNERELVVNGTLAAVFRVYTLDSAQELLCRVAGSLEENPVEVEAKMNAESSLDNPVEEEAIMNLDNDVNFSENDFVYVKVHTTETVKHLDTSTFRNIWKTLRRRERRKLKCPAVSDFCKTYPMEPPLFSGCSFIVMYNRGESLLTVNLKDRFGTFSLAKPRLRELKSKVEKLGEICVHGDILPHNVAVDKDGNLALFDYDEAVLLDSPSPERSISDKAGLLRYPNVLRTQYQKEYSAVQFSLIVRFIAEALECSEREKSSLESLYKTHDDLANAMNEVLRDQLRTKQILPLVDKLKGDVNSMLLEDNSAEAPVN